LLAALFAVLVPFAAPAQDPPGLGYPTSTEAAPPILTLDQDRLFTESAFGKRVAAAIEDRSRELATENRQLEAELTAEEKALTEARPTLAATEFRAKADAFDAKVQRIRAEQDDKARALTAFRDAERQRFAAALGPILAEIARERGALAVMDRRVMVISADSIDITDAAVAAVDAALGSGAADAPKIGDAPPDGAEAPPETPPEMPPGDGGN
jgi:Skp family chaperone for outer membrane proteins